MDYWERIIFGTEFSFDIELRYGAGAFVCGEETALIHSMEGKRGEPTIKPPFPSVAGLPGQADHGKQRGDICQCLLHHPERT